MGGGLLDPSSSLNKGLLLKKEEKPRGSDLPCFIHFC